MLDAIRSNTQSFLVKLAFGVIILVFVFWGIGSFTETDSSRVMAQVNGEPILEPQFYKRYQRIEQQLMSQGSSHAQLKEQHLGRLVLQNMIARLLVLQEAKRLGLGISPVELRQAIEQNPLFLNEKGQLDKDSYARGLNALRLSAADFEQQMREELLYDKMLELVSSSVWVDPDLAHRRFQFMFEKRILDYLFVPAQDFLAQATVNEEEVKKYYEEHQAVFTIPKKAQITSISVSPEKLVDPQSISLEAAQKWYKTNLAKYTQKEAVRAAHILVPLNENASEQERSAALAKIHEIQAELAKGKEFAALADAHNQPNAAGPGGELGWIERGVTVPPFEEAAFSQAAGVVSKEPIATQFGLHLILVHEKRPEKVTPFDEAKAELLKTMAKEEGRDKVSEVGESLLEDALLGKDLNVSAARFGLKAEKSGLLSAEEFVSKMHFSPSDATQLLSGTPVDTLLQAGDDVMVVRVDTTEKESLKPLEIVKGEIEKTLREQKALEAAMAKATELRKTLKNGPISQEERTQRHLESTKPVERSGLIEPFMENHNLSRACFEAKPGQWLSQVFSLSKADGSRGAGLFHVREIQKASEEDWERIHGILENGAAREAGENIRSLFIDQLLKRAKITDVHFEKADRFDG